MDLMDTAHVHDHNAGDDEKTVNLPDSGPFFCDTQDLPYMH